VRWEDLRGARPEVAVVMPCGYYVAESSREADEHSDGLAAVGAKRIWAVDAASHFSRPGPRLADGVELLAHLLHPDRAAAPTRVHFTPVKLSEPAPGATAAR
jgi:iron complex transport system substrate-binding protein